MADVHGNRTIGEMSGKPSLGGRSGAESGALGARGRPFDTDLAAVVDAWSALPEATRSAILAMIRAEFQ
jgi:hypothetical protein